MSDTHISVRQAETSHSECRAVADILARIGDKWTVMVIGVLSHGPMRYNQLHRAVEGISQRMLTLTLKGLEQDGLLKRTVYPTVPPRVDYQLTELGLTLIVPLQSLYEWAVENRPAMQAARKKFAQNKPETGLS
ncbi:winged helix-turn-helix transcriptional regulator [Methylomonas paludis]|nr:helix-turn-helix domain-containing protein [Methylomonas paludis]